MRYLPLILILASCVQKQDVTPLTRIYQPKVLILPPNTEVKTKEGMYLSNQTEYEIFHSAETVERLEKQLSEFK